MPANTGDCDIARLHHREALMWTAVLGILAIAAASGPIAAAGHGSVDRPCLPMARRRLWPARWTFLSVSMPAWFALRLGLISATGGFVQAIVTSRRGAGAASLDDAPLPDPA